MDKWKAVFGACTCHPHYNCNTTANAFISKWASTIHRHRHTHIHNSIMCNSFGIRDFYPTKRWTSICVILTIQFAFLWIRHDVFPSFVVVVVLFPSPFAVWQWINFFIVSGNIFKRRRKKYKKREKNQFQFHLICFI